MKKLTLLCLFAAMAVNAASAQDATKLSKWVRPANTEVAQVETYLNACEAMYKEAIAIRAQYDAIDTAQVDLIAISEEAGGESDALQKKRDEYNAVLERLNAQQEPAMKLPDLASAAVSSIPKSLKAVAVTKAVNSGKDCIKLVLEENTALLKAVTQQITTLNAAPVKE